MKGKPNFFKREIENIVPYLVLLAIYSVITLILFSL